MIYKRGNLSFLLVFFCLFLGACQREPKIPTDNYQRQSVKDINLFPQDLEVYARLAGANKLLWDEADAARFKERYLRQYYYAWEASKPGKGNLDYFKAILNRKGQSRGYAENLQPWDDLRWQEMTRNANLAAAPSLLQAAITCAPASLRLAPSSRPRFVSPQQAGQAYPFDEFQQSALPAGFPVMIFHRSLDAQWLYVESGLASGWIEADKIALMSAEQRQQWQALPLAAIIDDAFAPVAGIEGSSGLGTLLPLSATQKGSLLLLFPERDSNGQAQLRNIVADSSQAARWPLKPSPKAIAQLGNQMMGQPYGWGGLYGNRDCSSLLHDLFTPFGLWLPRNSAAQAKSGPEINLNGLSRSEKEARIREQGLPFQSLLWLRGHVTLYLGQYKGQALVFHNIWGIRTLEADGSSGRHILGRAVVTSTKPGAELAKAVPGGLLLDRMETLTLLGQ